MRSAVRFAILGLILALGMALLPPLQRPAQAAAYAGELMLFAADERDGLRVWAEDRAGVVRWTRVLPTPKDDLPGVLRWFTAQGLEYTLDPGTTSADSVDTTLFDTRRGFCAIMPPCSRQP